MKASDFFTKRYLLGYTTQCGEKVYSDAFNTKRDLIEYQNSEFYRWYLNHFRNLTIFVEYHQRRGFVVRDFDFIKARKYQILALKRARFGKSSYTKQLHFCVKHKGYFDPGIDCNSLCEMREIPC